MENGKKEEWENILKLIKEYSEWFPEGIIFIGGTAVFQHTLNSAFKHLSETSHDIDFALRLLDFDDLRNLESVTANKRLKKHTFSKKGCEFDVYLEHNNGLVVSYEELFSKSVTLNGIRVACLEHLLLLKLEALKDRSNSSKGEKDKRDVVRIIIVMGKPHIEYLAMNWSKETEDAVRDIINDPNIFIGVAKGNQNEAKKIRDIFRGKWDEITWQITQQSLDNSTKGYPKL